ncbi:hypothetical protein D9757_008977 [Collybiopsis confluens]|uniref:DyP dimeric alpha+beta barrel domain-containing protein n=1 Tax=Collybiopsis confluens TaxID=2823264 RepID=A0A8H5H356_9AGAR|nr:hypothetical protein D9757_008977 [Collybiopsis confluens]
MKLTHVSLLAASILQGVHAASLDLKPRKSSILINPPAQPALPSAQDAASAAATAGLNLTNIQGDILIGMKKHTELFLFFKIQNVKAFKSQLGAKILPLITSTTKLLSVSTQPTTAVNIAFSQRGLTALGVTDNLGDSDFSSGQFSGASSLGDQTSNWVPQFSGTDIDGVLLLASDTIDNVNTMLSNIETAVNGSVSEVYRIQGAARPGSEQGHEHFGFMDGISNPAVDGFSTPLPGQAVVAPGIILLGEQGDSTTRPSWAKDGSFLAFRQLKQRVPEFNKFLLDNALVEPTSSSSVSSIQNGSELLGARMMGRWKSGAPVDLTPLVDDPVLAADPQRNNNFNFTHPDLGTFVNHIIRAGIPYGPEVTNTETTANVSSTDATLERGLAFVAYQSSIGSGFAFLQQFWANNAFFHTVSLFATCNYNENSVGEDPIIGVASGDGPRHPGGLDPQDPTKVITINEDFVVSRGGEYFFSPSLSAIQNTLAV